MLYIYVALIILQMVAVNLFISFKFSKIRYSRTVNMLILIVYSVLLFYLVHNSFHKLYELDCFEGNGIFLIIVASYVVPLLITLKQPIKITLTIFLSAWIYTYLVFALSVRIGHLFGEENLQLIILTSQTLLHILTIRFTYRILKNQFIYTLWNSNEKIIDYMFFLSFSLLALIAISNYTFIEGISPITGFVIIFVITSITLLSYNLAFLFSRVNESAEVFLKKSRTDTLTGLKNRAALMDDINNKILVGIPFNLIFLDLDNFKYVNDVFGHAKGDEYLINFCKEMLKRFYRTNFYRISGDEFVIIVDGEKLENDELGLESISYVNKGMGIKFLGLSAGSSHYPTDAKNLSDLLSRADYNMYQKKKVKHKNLDTPKY